MQVLDVDEMLENMTMEQLLEWREYYALEPFGEERGDLRAGIVASTLANIHRRRGQRAFQPRDFMPKFGQPRGARFETATKEQFADFKQFVIAMATRK